MNVVKSIMSVPDGVAGAGVDHPSGADGLVWHLAYGANLTAQSLTKMRKVTPRATLRGRVPGYQYSTRFRGLPLAEPSFATIERVPASVPTDVARRVCLHGSLMLITRADMRKIQLTEGGGGHSGVGYELEPVEVEVYPEDVAKIPDEAPRGHPVGTSTSDGASGAASDSADAGTRTRQRGAVMGAAKGAATTITALALVGHATTLYDGLAPSKRYRDLVARGAKECRLHPEYAEWLEQYPCHEPTVMSTILSWLLLGCVGPVFVGNILWRKKMGYALFAMQWLLHVQLSFFVLVCSPLPAFMGGRNPMPAETPANSAGQIYQLRISQFGP